MKMDFRLLVAAATIFNLSACGEKVSTNAAQGEFQKPTEECTDNIVPGQFIVRYLDGRTEIIHANSADEFIDGFLSDHREDIEFAEHDFRVSFQRKATVENSVTVVDNWGAIRTNASALWQMGIYGESVTVAVIDSGMDVFHPQLQKQIALNEGELGLDGNGRDKTRNGIDDDKDGFIDNVYGVDFVANRGLTFDYNYHGSHVAGIIAAEHADTEAKEEGYVQGLAPKAKLLPLAFIDESGSGTISDSVRAVEFAVKKGARIINASWGGPTCSRSLSDTIQGLSSLDVYFVAASGNSGQNIDVQSEYPAAFTWPSVFTVGATGPQDLMTDFSNYGLRRVHIFAPGSKIISTVPGQGKPAGYSALSGTSMATPFVAGAIALLLSAEPKASLEQVRQALYQSAYKRDFYTNASSGRLDLKTSLTTLRQLLGR